VSHLHPGDEHLHYADASHAWIGPNCEGQEAWEAEVRAHIEAHRENPDGGTMPWRPVPPPPE